MILAAEQTGWMGIALTAVIMLVVIGVPAWLRIRKGDKVGDVLRDVLDQSVAFLAKQGKVDDARSVQNIARGAIIMAGEGVKSFNDAKLKQARDASPIDLAEILAEAERKRAASEGGAATREAEGDR